MIRNFILLVIIAFVLKSEALASLKNNSAIENALFANETASLSGFETTLRNNMAKNENIPEILVKMYLANAKDDGTLRGNSRKLPPAVHVIIGQATPEPNAVSFNLNNSDIRINKRILSANIRVLVEITGPLPPLPLRGRLVLFDRLTHRAISSVVFQGGGARWVVFPVRSLVQRWLFSRHLNRGIFLGLKSHNPDVKGSLKVRGEETGAKLNNRPLLIVQTHFTEAQSNEEILFASKMPKITRKSRRSRAVARDEGSCSIRPMRVNVRQDLHLNEIFFPRYFDSFRCGGDCKFPLDNSVNPTGHSIIRSILYLSRNDQGAGEPCCVPIKLLGLSVFLMKEDEVTIKSHQGMIVEECGCR